jgi:hypothetical protein
MKFKSSTFVFATESIISSCQEPFVKIGCGSHAVSTREVDCVKRFYGQLRDKIRGQVEINYCKE